jgi:hypothetical protein
MHKKISSRRNCRKSSLYREEQECSRKRRAGRKGSRNRTLGIAVGKKCRRCRKVSIRKEQHEMQ